MNIDTLKYIGLFMGILSIVLLFIAGGTYIDIMNQTKNCTSIIGTMDSIGYAEEYTFEEIQTYNAPNKNIYVTLENGSNIMFRLNQSHRVEDIEDRFPLGKSYIFTLCNDIVRGFSKNDWSNRQFYHKYRKAEQ